MRTIRALQTEIDNWIKAYGVRYFSELTNLAILMEEVGELGRLMSREYGEQSFKEGEKKIDTKEAIADELSDVLFVITCLANQMDINLDEAINKNLEKKTRRDTNRHKENKKLH